MAGRRAFLTLAVAELMSIGGTRLAGIAIPWLVLTSTGSPVLSGLVAAAELIPYVIAKALGGPMVDRLGPRTVAIACDGASAIAVLLLPLLDRAGLLDPAVLVPVVMAIGALRGPADAAKQAMVPAVAEGAGLPLERVTGVIGGIERLATTVGAAGAGALIAVVGPAPALAVNALGFALSALLIGVGLRRSGGTRAVAKDAGLPYGAALREGWIFLRGDPVLRAIVAMVAVTNLLDQAFATVLLPVWATENGGDPARLGLLFASFSAASVVGAGLAAAFGERLPRLAVYTVAFILAGLPRFAVFAVEVDIAVVYGVMAAAGFASGFLNPILSAVILGRVPRPLVGRITALTGAACWTLMPFGGLIAGAAIAAVGLPGAILAAGVAYFAVTMAPLAGPAFRAFDRPAEARAG